jgi:anthranilate synthase component II
MKICLYIYIFASLINLSQIVVKVLIIDNYDSFTFNLSHYVEAFHVKVEVFRNDKINFDEVKKFDKVILSPGPGLPEDAGQLMEFIQHFYSKIPILGVCLGMQALALFFGDELYNQEMVKHGISMPVRKTFESKLVEEMPETFKVGLYHSWAINLKKESSFIPTLISEEGVLMAFEHRNLPLYGVQFHPESIMTENGKKIIENFLFR